MIKSFQKKRETLWRFSIGLVLSTNKVLLVVTFSRLTDFFPSLSRPQGEGELTSSEVEMFWGCTSVALLKKGKETQFERIKKGGLALYVTPGMQQVASKFMARLFLDASFRPLAEQYVHTSSSSLHTTHSFSTYSYQAMADGTAGKFSGLLLQKETQLLRELEEETANEQIPVHCLDLIVRIEKGESV